MFISKSLHSIAFNTQILVVTLPQAGILLLSKLLRSRVSSAIPFLSDQLEHPFRHAHVFRTAWFCFTVIKRTLAGKDWFVAQRPNFGVIWKRDGSRKLLVLEYRLVLQELDPKVGKNYVSGGEELPVLALFCTQGLNDVPKESK